MDYKEKYEKALAKAREFESKGIHGFDEIFPELKESEDESIRKEIIDFIYDKTDTYELREKSNSWLAWLEKQCEQPQGKSALEAAKEEKVDNQNCSSAGKVKPKFKVGAFIVDIEDNEVFQVTRVLDNTYEITSLNGEDFGILHYVADYNCRKWNISKDAKEGDVLAANNGVIILVKESRGSAWGYRLSYYCAVLYDGSFEPREFHVNPEKFYPATKEQRDQLFKAMADAGYEWSSEYRKLIKIAQ